MNRTLQLVSIQHELSMNIGLGLELEQMLHAFIQRAQHRLSLSAVTITYNLSNAAHQLDGTSDTCLSFPQQSQTSRDWLQDKACALFSQQNGTYVEHELNDYFYYFFVIPHFGVLILERKHKAIDTMILHALLPLLEKLANSCQACIEHQNLKAEIEARKQAEQLLIQQSLLDPLTSLPNRKMLNLKLREALHEAAQGRCFSAVFFIDLDRFKVINDSYGHNVGDQVLKFVAQRLLNSTSEEDTLARMGGDEFILLAKNLSTDRQSAIEKAKRIAEKLSLQVAKPIYIEDNSLSISISTGISLVPAENAASKSIEQQANTVIRRADIAMYSIKHGNRNGFNFFTKDLQSLAEKHTQVENHLKYAIERHELEVHYQPLVNAHNQIMGAEALLRWNNGQLGQVSPADFIPVAEESGLIIELGKWVLAEACKLLNRLKDLGKPDSLNYISVNVSPRQFNQPSFVQDVVRLLETYNINGNQIRIEITEGVAIDNIDLAIRKMLQLREFHIECMLDDFGSGYSSLSYLNKLPLKTIKIDRSFVSQIDASEYHQVIVNAVKDICNYSQLECIAEGVETDTELQYLQSRGISAYQGFYFHRPMPVKALLTLL
ncbi:EAL domain-containing protein [Paraglaciecola aquimarina]|uniref:EAL domain-containing protein n=1 Tax=Paraglaciecola aquimarina TaxID=1235557 RepID=A0ABU3SSG0_9ALTE|nr:EAL domain-containing protein [Paraglaciecola aquimarina]MDU0352952.1 EAL domain-containing protein [Paraglaciecola aquimarina]